MKARASSSRKALAFPILMACLTIALLVTLAFVATRLVAAEAAEASAADNVAGLPFALLEGTSGLAPGQSPAQGAATSAVSAGAAQGASDLQEQELLSLDPAVGGLIAAAVLTVAICLVFVVFYRTACRTERRLAGECGRAEEARSRACDANSAKSEFLSRMSHEIRTPLNGIMGMTAIAQRSLGDEEKVRSCLERVETSSRQLLSLVNDVLDMSKVESGKLELSLHPFDVRRFVEAQDAQFQGSAREQGIIYCSYVADDVPPVLVGDALRLGQIVCNLVGNALKFTNPGGQVTLRIRTAEASGGMKGVAWRLGEAHDGMMGAARCLEKERDIDGEKRAKAACAPDVGDGDIPCGERVGNVASDGVTKGLGGEVQWIRLSVEDTGCGIHPENMERVFDPFEQEDGQVARLHGGTGLGLAITKRLVELMGGTIEVESEVGRGSVFFAMVPFGVAPAPNSAFVSAWDSAPSAPSSSDGGPSPQPLFGRRLLVVEDTPLNLEIARDLLEMGGAQVDEATDGREALARFAASPIGHYDAVLMDVQMPVMDGYEAAEALRVLGRPDARRVPVIAMTAHAFVQDEAKSLSHGMNGHISKPLDVRTIYDKINGFLND